REAIDSFFETASSAFHGSSSNRTRSRVRRFPNPLAADDELVPPDSPSPIEHVDPVAPGPHSCRMCVSTSEFERDAEGEAKNVLRNPRGSPLHRATRARPATSQVAEKRDCR